MKRCPQCRRDYYDDSLSFCLEDGTPLVYGISADEPATAVLDGSQGSSSIRSDEPQTAILPNTSSLGADSSLREPHSAEHRSGARSFDKRLILAPVLLACIVLIGFAAYRYYPAAKQIESIAVMPFVNTGGSPDMEYLSDGMTDTLINNLSRIPNLSVKARSSVFKYKGSSLEPKDIAADLNVHAVVTGRVLQRGDDLTLNLELVDARSGNQIWGEQYVRKVGDLVTLQSDIARDVSNKLRQKLTGGDAGGRSVRDTENPEAYREYLKGRYHWNRRTKEDINKSIDHFEKAIAIDPSFALALAGLADAYVVIPSYSNNRAKEAYPKARAAAMRALEIDDSLAPAHATLGCVLHEFDWKFDEAEREFKRAIELDPNYATAHHWYAELLLTLRRQEEAVAEIDRAKESDPLSLIINSMAGLIYGLKGDFAASEAQLKKTIEMDPNFGRARLHLAAVYEWQGKFEEALDQYEKHLLLKGLPASEVANGINAVRQAYRNGGEKAYWKAFAPLAEEQLKKDPENGPPYFGVGVLYAQAGDTDRAFEYFERSLERREPDILRLKERNVDELTSDPRFEDLLRRLNAPK